MHNECSVLVNQPGTLPTVYKHSGLPNALREGECTAADEKRRKKRTWEHICLLGAGKEGGNDKGTPFSEAYPQPRVILI